MLKPEAKFERLVEIVYKLDDKEWYTWYLNDSTKDTLLDFLEKNIVMRGLDFTRGTVYRTIWDSTDERTIGIAQDITSCVKEIIEDKYIEYCHEYLDEHKNKCSTKEVTRQQLEELGVVYVTEDGDVYTYNGKEVIKKTPYEIIAKRKYSTNKKRYLYVGFYSPITHKQFNIALHRIVYAWFNGVARAGMTIDHIDNNEQNNNIHNLREITLEENLSRKTVSRNQYNWDLSDEEILSRRYEKKYRK